MPLPEPDSESEPPPHPDRLASTSGRGAPGPDFAIVAPWSASCSTFKLPVASFPRLLPGGGRYGAPRLQVAQCAKAPVCGPCPASDQRPHVRVITKLEICSPAGHRDWPRAQWQSQCDGHCGVTVAVARACTLSDPRPLQLGDVRSFERCPQHPLLKALRIRVDRALALRVRALELASIAVSSLPASVPHAHRYRPLSASPRRASQR
jgi:hypothetical protein